MTSASDKPNIRIEIKNDININECEADESEAMDIDTSSSVIPLLLNQDQDDIEDGEISDDTTVTLTTLTKNNRNRTIVLNATENEPQNDGRMSDDDEDNFSEEKREIRAKRFGLEHEVLSDQQLFELHESLGITTDEEKTNTRFDALHMYGTQEMSTQDVYEYFGKYTPNSVEWINDESCNVTWLDKGTAARALNTLSKIIDGMPVRGNSDPFPVDDFEPSVKKNGGTSILLMDDTAKREQNTINVTDLNIPIPPGYWRLGDSAPKSKYILLRYAKRSDKKPFRAEKFSDYYRKYGRAADIRRRGIISESKKARMKAATAPHHAESKGNPWGRLAEDWNNDVLERPEDPVATFKPKASKSLLNRLGTTTTTKTTKRSISPPPPPPVVNSASEEGDEPEAPPVKKSKVPRMRMYADEEEARVTKIKEMKKIRALEKIEENILDNHVADLRNRLKKTHHHHQHEPPRKQLITSRLQLHSRPTAIKQEIKVTARNDFRKSDSSESSDEAADDVNVQQRSKVTVIVKKQSRPTVASTIWSRLADEKKQTNKNRRTSKKGEESDSHSSSGGSGGSSSSSTNNTSDSESESETTTTNTELLSKTTTLLNNPRPGFRKDLKSRLGLNTTSSGEHKSPLRIEINNDHYNSNSKT